MRLFLGLILIAAFTSAARADECDNAMDQANHERMCGSVLQEG